jgi:hypothetical protein
MRSLLLLLLLMPISQLLCTLLRGKQSHPLHAYFKKVLERVSIFPCVRKSRSGREKVFIVSDKIFVSMKMRLLSLIIRHLLRHSTRYTPKSQAHLGKRNSRNAGGLKVRRSSLSALKHDGL